MTTLFRTGATRRARKGAAVLGLTLSLPFIALGTASSAAAAPGTIDTPFSGGVFASGADYIDTSSTAFASVNETTLEPAVFGNANMTLPDGARSFDGLAYNPVNDYLYTTTDDGHSADISLICNAPIVEFVCNELDGDGGDDEGEGPLIPISLAAEPGAPDVATSVAALDAATVALITQIEAQATPDAVAVPEPKYVTGSNFVPGEPDLYQLDAEGDLSFIGRIPAPATPAVPTTPGIGFSHSAALGFAASSAADGTYLIPGLQLRASLDIEALIDRLNGDSDDEVLQNALASITSPFIDALLPELVIEAGLSVGHVDPATAATTYVDVDLSAPSCLGVNTYAAAGQLSNVLTNLLFGPAGPATPELLGGGLLDWAVSPSNGMLYSYVTPGLLGLLYPDAPEAVILAVDPDTGAAVCSPIGEAAAGIDDIVALIEDGGSLEDLVELLAPIFFPVGGNAFMSDGSMLLWATTLRDTLYVIPAEDLAACIAGSPCGLVAQEPSLEALVIGDLASNPFPNLSVTPTLAKGTTAVTFGFTVTPGGYAPVQLAQNQTGTYQAVPTNTELTITDTVPAGFDLVSVTCTDGTDTITPAITADSVTIEIVSAVDVSCTFVHDAEPQLAATGTENTVPLTVLGLGLLLGGAAMTVATRRRTA